MIFMGFGGFGVAGTFVHAMMALGIAFRAVEAFPVQRFLSDNDT